MSGRKFRDHPLSDFYKLLSFAEMEARGRRDDFVVGNETVKRKPFVYQRDAKDLALLLREN